MRLPMLDRPKGIKARLIYLFTRLRLGATPDIVKIMLYRRPFFGAFALPALHQALRGASRWTFAERELFAAATASALSVPYCATNHSVWASYGLLTRISPEALADPESLPVGPEASAAVAFARKLATTPGQVEQGDVDRLRELGIAAQDIGTVVHVVGLFTTVGLIANALGFTVLSEDQSRKLAPRFFKRGYQF